MFKYYYKYPTGTTKTRQPAWGLRVGVLRVAGLVRVGERQPGP